MHPTGDGSNGPKPTEDSGSQSMLARGPADDDEQRSAALFAEGESSIVQLMFEARRMRSKLFDPAIFGGEAAWDILLALYRAELEGRPQTRESLATELDVPHSVLDRWLQYFDRSGMVCAAKQASAVRFSSLTLTGTTRKQLVRYFEIFASAISSAKIGRGPTSK